MTTLKTLLISIALLGIFPSIGHAASCSLSSNTTSQLNTLLAPYETKLRALSVSEAKGKIDGVLPRLQTLKSLALFMDAASACMIDTVKERLSSFSNEVSNPSSTSSGSRIGTGCPPLDPSVKIIAAEGGKDDFGANAQRLFYTQGKWQQGGVKAKQINAYEFISPKSYAWNYISTTETQRGGRTSFDVTLSQCPGDFRESVPKECRWHAPASGANFRMSSDGKMTMTVGTGTKTYPVCNIGYNKRWYLNFRPLPSVNFNPDVVSENWNWNYAGFIFDSSMQIGGIKTLEQMKQIKDGPSCKGEVPNADFPLDNIALVSKQLKPDAYPENDNWRYGIDQLACTWSCPRWTTRKGNGCVPVDYRGTFGEPVLVKKWKGEVNDKGDAGKSWANGQRGPRGEYAGGDMIPEIGPFKNYTLPATKVELPTEKRCMDNFVYFKLSNPTNCRIYIESWQCAFDVETWRIPCIGQTDPAGGPEDM